MIARQGREKDGHGAKNTETVTPASPRSVRLKIEELRNALAQAQTVADIADLTERVSSEIILGAEKSGQQELEEVVNLRRQMLSIEPTRDKIATTIEALKREIADLESQTGVQL